MPAPIHIKLTGEADQTLQALSAADGVPRRSKQRATALRLNATGWRVPPIAQYLNCLSLWQNSGWAGLWDRARPGRPCRWSAADWQALASWLAPPRRYSAPPLSQQLARERQVHLGPEPIRGTLKKRTTAGNASVKPLPSTQKVTGLGQNAAPGNGSSRGRRLERWASNTWMHQAAAVHRAPSTPTVKEESKNEAINANGEADGATFGVYGSPTSGLTMPG
jgi:hypothetical protein